MFTLEELRKIDIEKIKKELIDTEKTLYKARFEVKTSQSKDHHMINVNKRYIARMKTILTQRKAETVTKSEPAKTDEAKTPETPKTPKTPKKRKASKKTKAPKEA